MQEILKSLDDSNICNEYEILDYKQGSDFYYIKIKAKLAKGYLYINVYMSEKEYNYSFHWQKDDGKLIIRWDNSPHHKNIETFPHHKHINKAVESSKEISLRQVLKYIKKLMDL